MFTVLKLTGFLSMQDAVALPKETEKRPPPRLPQKMNQRPTTQDIHVLPKQTDCSPGSYSQPKDRLGSICSLETIPGVAMVSPTSTLARRSSSAEFSGAAAVCAHGSSSEALPPRLPFVSSQSKSDSGPQSRPEEGPQPGPIVPPRSKSDCGLETQPLVHMSRSKVVNERSRLSPSESPLPTRRPSPKLPENAVPFPYTCSPITPKVVVQCIDKKRAQTPPPPVPLRLDDSRRPRYETRYSPGLVSGCTSDPTWDDALYDDLHRKLMSVPASGGFMSDPAAIYVASPYVHFTKDKETSGYPEKNEYFYPNLDAVSGLPPVSSQRGLALPNAYRDYRNLSKTAAQPPVPPLPIKPHQRHGMNHVKKFPRKSSDLYRSDSANFKSKCTYCGEYFSVKENRRGACADGPDAFRNCAKACVCPAAALVYHCADEEDSVPTDLWTCGTCDRKSCRQWTVLTIVCLLLPCMWCFLPMRSCHRCGVACGCCGARHQAALPLASNV